MNKGRIRRVDAQVSIFTAIIVLLSIFSVSAVYYHVTYLDMINSLNDRVNSIYQYVDASLDKSSFAEINCRADQEKQSYQEMKRLLENVKNLTGVRYLYTAKQAQDGSFIYIIDGLDAQAEDFRYAGDLIEREIYPDMERALSGECVLPQEIKNTEWGKIFITYFPIHDGNQVVGVLGIEFEAEHQYNTYLLMRILTPVTAALACLVAVLLAVIFFRRISNPTYQDMSNTDQLTQLKNRNAYDIDMKNLKARGAGQGLSVMVLDLNHLKLVNDTLGHQAGDAYISSAAQALKNAMNKGAVLYRIGGDEFVALVQGATVRQLERFAETLHREFALALQKEPKLQCEFPLSLAIGYAAFDDGQDEDIYCTYRRADKEMYENKRSLHNERRGC